MLLFFAGVDVLVLAGAGVEVPGGAVVLVPAVACEGSPSVAVISADDCSTGDVPPRSGERRCSVACGWRERSPTVLEGCRLLPACSRRTSAGGAVEAERKLRTSEMVLQGLTFKGIAAVDMLAVSKVL